MVTEDTKTTSHNIDLPLASDPLTLSHEKAPEPPVTPAALPSIAESETEKTAAGAASGELRSSVRLSDVVKTPQDAPQAETSPGVASSAKKNPPPAAERIKICPKCAHRQNEFFACRSCGLIFRNWRPEMERELFAAMPDSVYAAVQEMWRGLENDWESEEAHEKFFQFCKVSSAMPYATRAYRMYAARHPEDARVAGRVKKCAEFVGGTLQMPTVQGRSDKSSSITSAQITIAVSIGVVAIILVFIFFDYILK